MSESKRFIFLKLSTEHLSACCMSLQPFKSYDSKAIFICFPPLTHCFVFSAPQNLIRKCSVCRSFPELARPCFAQESEVQHQRGFTTNIFVLFLQCSKEDESLLNQRQSLKYILVLSLWKITSALHFVFQSVPKGTMFNLHLFLSIYGTTNDN